MKKLILIPLIAIAAAGCQAGTQGSSTGSDTFQHAEDVSIASCTPDTSGDLDAKVTVTNNSSKPSNYIITIKFVSADGKTQLDTSPVVVNNLDAGQTSNEDAFSATPATPGYQCQIADATRTAA